MAVELKIGDVAPDFEATTDTGDVTKLSDYRGKRVILYFYPKDDTPGCTTQGCGFRDNYAMIEDSNSVVLGVSPDGVTSHQKFKAKFGLPFTLVVDDDHAICEAYGVWIRKPRTGKMGVLRSHYVIDEQGRIADAQVGVSPEDSVRLALEMLQAE